MLYNNAEKNSFIKRNRKLSCGTLVQLMFEPDDVEIQLIKKREEKIEKAYNLLFEKCLSKKTPKEKSLIKRYLEEHPEQESLTKQRLIDKYLEEHPEETPKEEPEIKLSFKGRSFYSSCVDDTNGFRKHKNIYSKDVLYAHYMVERSGMNPDLNIGTEENLEENSEKKVHLHRGRTERRHYYNTYSLNKDGISLRQDLVKKIVENYPKVKEEQTELYNSPFRYTIRCIGTILNKKGEEEKVAIYLDAEDLISYYNEDIKPEYTTISSSGTDKGKVSAYVHIPIEVLKKRSYWIEKAPKKEDEPKYYGILKNQCRRPSFINGQWTMSNGGEPNFDPDKSDMGELIWTRERYAEYNRGKEQFLVLMYDKYGNKINIVALIDNELKMSYQLLNSKNHFFDFLHEKGLYKGNKSKSTFCRDGYKDYINKPIEYNGNIIYILSSEDTNLAQDFTNTKLDKVGDTWIFHFCKKFAEKVIKAGKEIFYVAYKSSYKLFVNLKYVLAREFAVQNIPIPEYKIE